MGVPGRWLGVSGSGGGVEAGQAFTEAGGAEAGDGFGRVAETGGQAVSLAV